MGPLDILTGTELEHLTDRAYTACMTYYDTLEARNDVHTPAWKAMRAAATEQAELHRELCGELARRNAERNEIRASLAAHLDAALLGEIDA